MRKSVLISTLCISIMMLWVGNSAAFHDEGVAYCGGCHTMHNSQNGVKVNASGPYEYLLKYATPSDVCLSCHTQSSPTSQSGRAVLSLDPLNPNYEMGAGDFVFLTEDNINDGHNGATNPMLGHKAGHSIVAPSKSLAADPVLSVAPGDGSSPFPSSLLGCSSCHDPHGNESFRLLNGAHPIQDGQFLFTNPAPVAIGVALSSGLPGVPAPPESETNHTAYQSGMSAWCGNCHGDFHNSGDWLHASGEPIDVEYRNIYYAYNGTDDLTGGAQATSYIPDVPFEDPANTVSSTDGPTSSSKVSCITCHRAHATSGPDAGRWDFNVTVLEEDGHESGSYPIPNSYVDNSATNDQRSLCNKCHKKDEFDALDVYP